MRARRARYFVGDAAPYAALEDLFLDMEGVAQWAALAATRRESGWPTAAALEMFRAETTWWSQDEGLALYLALDALVPGWQRRVFPPELASGVELLEAAVAAPASRAAAATATAGTR